MDSRLYTRRLVVPWRAWGDTGGLDSSMPLDVLVGSDFPLRIEDRIDYWGAVFCSLGIVRLDSIFRRDMWLSRLADAHEDLQIGLSFSILAAGPQKEVQIGNSHSASLRRSKY